MFCIRARFVFVWGVIRLFTVYCVCLCVCVYLRKIPGIFMQEYVNHVRIIGLGNLEMEQKRSGGRIAVAKNL